MNLQNKPIAMAYVPWQHFENVLDSKCALEQGSIFEDLIFPFIGSQAACQSLNNNNRRQSNSNNQRMSSYSYGMQRNMSQERRCPCQ